MNAQPIPGRLLALDYGLKVIGVATCDPTGTVTRPLQIIRRTSKKADFALIEGLVRDLGAVAIVVGLPVSPPEITAYTAADRVRLWSSRLAAAVSVPVVLWNERYSSQEAEELLLEAGSEVPDRVDAVAAAVILQSFLEGQREGMPWPEPVAPASE